MKAVAVFEAKNRFSELLAAAEQGDTITITRRGVPVARLVAEQTVPAVDVAQRTRAALARLQALRTNLTLDGDLKALARAGLD
jgi:prevent-host-death family protein